MCEKQLSVCKASELVRLTVKTVLKNKYRNKECGKVSNLFVVFSIK